MYGLRELSRPPWWVHRGGGMERGRGAMEEEGWKVLSSGRGSADARGRGRGCAEERAHWPALLDSLRWMAWRRLGKSVAAVTLGA